MSQENIEKMIYEETERRLKVMESSGYKFPGQISKTDIFGIVFVVGISAVLIFLCMMGVIE